MKRRFIVLMLLIAAAATAAAAPATSETERVADAARVIRELRSAPDNGIPESIWDRARCVAVMPDVKKAAFVIGGEFGKGVVSCKTANGWSAPVFLRLEKGSFGAQIGAESTDLVLLVMNEHGDRAALAGQGHAWCGCIPGGWTRWTQRHRRHRRAAHCGDALVLPCTGLFAGIDLSGGVLRPDNDASRDFYGHAVAGREILLGKAGDECPPPRTRSSLH